MHLRKRGRIARMCKQVQCISSSRARVHTCVNACSIRIPPTVPSYGTIPLKRWRSSSSDRLPRVKLRSHVSPRGARCDAMARKIERSQFEFIFEGSNNQEDEREGVSGEINLCTRLISHVTFVRI